MRRRMHGLLEVKSEKIKWRQFRETRLFFFNFGRQVKLSPEVSRFQQILVADVKLSH